MRGKRILLFCLVITCFLLQAALAANVVNVTRQEADALLQKDKNIVVLDLRTPEEFAHEHLPGALNLPFPTQDFNKEVQEVVKKHPSQAHSQTWMIYCRSGNRTSKALPSLEKELPGTIYHLNKGLQQQ